MIINWECLNKFLLNVCYFYVIKIFNPGPRMNFARAETAFTTKTRPKVTRKSWWTSLGDQWLRFSKTSSDHGCFKEIQVESLYPRANAVLSQRITNTVLAKFILGPCINDSNNQTSKTRLNLTPMLSATLWATDWAAILRGWVTTIRISSPLRLACCSRNWGTRVVLPQPVCPEMIVTAFESIWSCNIWQTFMWTSVARKKFDRKLN